MKEALEHDLITLATEILANEGEWNLAQLNKQAHKITEKIAILTFVEKYYQTLGASEDRMHRTMRKVSDFIDENQEEDIFDIQVEASEVHPLTAPETATKETPKKEPASQPAFVAMEPAPITKEEKTAPVEKPIVKRILQEESYSEPNWAKPTSRLQTATADQPIEKPKPVETAAVAFEIEQPTIEQSEQFIQQPQYTDEQRLLKQTPSLEEFISQSKNTVFDKKDTTDDMKPIQSLNDKFGKTLQIGLNDKLAFVQRLFFGSESEYNKVVKHLGELNSMQDAVLYIEQQVKPTYNYWKGKEEYEQRFLDLVLKRFEV